MRTLNSDGQRRRALGIYYTPRHVADSLASWALRDPRDSVLEPSFGGCALIEAAISRLGALGCPAPGERVRGFDVDEDAFTHLGRVVPAAFIKKHFANCDFLTGEPGTPYSPVTAILSNPPFVPYHRMSIEQRQTVAAWRRRHVPAFPMTASLWAYFLAHSLSFLAPLGRLAFVLPSSVVTADYSKPLIDHLRRRFERLAIVRLNEQLFLNVGAEERAVIILADGYDPLGSAASAIISIGLDSTSELHRVVEELRCRKEPAFVAPILTATAKSGLDTLKRRGTACPLGEIATVLIGEVIGDTRFFVKSVPEWKELGISTRDLSPIVTRTRQVPGLRLSRCDLDAGGGIVPKLLTPRDGTLASPVAAYLAAYPATVLAANCTFAKRHPWYRVSYNTDAAAFIGSLSHTGPRIVLNSSKITCANGLYKLVPSGSNPSWRAAVAASALSTVTQLSAELTARARGAGALKLEPSDVRRLLIPTTYLSLGASESRELIGGTDDLLRRGRRDLAEALVDDVLLIRPGVLTRTQVADLRAQLAIFRHRRLLGRTKQAVLQLGAGKSNSRAELR